MDQATPDLILEAPPDAETVLMLREHAQQTGESMIATFDDEYRRVLYFIVSDRGTCVLLADRVAVQTFNRELDAEKVAAALGAQA